MPARSARAYFTRRNAAVEHEARSEVRALGPRAEVEHFREGRGHLAQRSHCLVQVRRSCFLLASGRRKRTGWGIGAVREGTLLRQSREFRTARCRRRLGSRGRWHCGGSRDFKEVFAVVELENETLGARQTALELLRRRPGALLERCGQPGREVICELLSLPICAPMKPQLKCAIDCTSNSFGTSNS